MYGDEHERESSEPLNWRSVGVALALHLAAFVIFWIAAKIIHRTPELVIPIDMTIVVNENLDREVDEEEPTPVPEPPKPETPPPPPPKPEPKPEPEPPPKIDDKVEALIKEPEKPKKKEFKKAPLVKQEEKPPEKKVEPPKKPAKPVFRKGELKKGAPPPKHAANGPRTEKKMSQAEIAKWLALGARPGTRNQLAENEEQRCFSLIQRRFYDCWQDFTWSEGLRPVLLQVKFGPGGRIVGYSIVESSGDKQVDQSVLAAARRAGQVVGLSAQFLQQYPVVTVSMSPSRQ